MPTLYVTTSSMATWHILRPNEPQLVWCHADREGARWDGITMKVPASVCPVCQTAEAVSLSSELDRIPAVAGVL